MPTIATNPKGGTLIMNADDWGRDRQTTDRTFDCVLPGVVSAVSGMVFMADSERSAAIALEHHIDTGLHLNFTTEFSTRYRAAKLLEYQQRTARYLRANRFAPPVFNPALMGAFEYLVRAQIDEYTRLYGSAPHRLDGHHHMHLCANVLLAGLLPSGTAVRRNFSFRRGEKGWVNRCYRKQVDRMLARKHSLTDYFFSLTPLNPVNRLEGIFALAEYSVVEVETHPIQPDEYHFLVGGEVSRYRHRSLTETKVRLVSASNA